MGINIVKGKIHLFDLDGERIYIGITDSLINRINKEFENLNLNKNYFGKRFLYRLKIYGRLSLPSLKRISSKLDIPYDYIEKNITIITSHKSTHVGIRNPKLPFDFRNEEGMILIASIFGDGGISVEGNVRYHNQDKKLVDLFVRSLKVLGDVDFKIYLREDNTYHVSLPIIIGCVFSALGIKWGYKTKINPLIPDFIFKLNDKLKACFIRQFANDEGNVRLKDRRLQLKQTMEVSGNISKEQIKRDMDKYTPYCLSDIRKLLLDFNIVSKISLGDYRHEDSIKTDWELSIYGKENLEKFQKLIGFDAIHKNKNLEKCLKSYKFPSSGRNERLLFALQYAAQIEMENGFITKHLLAKYSRRALKTSTYFLVDLKKKHLVKIIEMPRTSLGHQLPVKYRLTDRGWNYLKTHKDRIFIENVRKST